MTDYVELRCKSAFSFLEGASSPEDLSECAAAFGYEALALCDRDGLYAAPRFHQAAKDVGLRPIFGAELSLEDEGKHSSLLALVETGEGYRNLSRLITLGRAHVPKGCSRLSWNQLQDFTAGLLFLLRGDALLDAETLARARSIAGTNQLWVDVCRHRDRASARAEARAIALARAQRVPLVATNDVRMASPEQRQVCDVFTCLRAKTTLPRAGRLLLPNAERHLKSPGEMKRLFADQPVWLRASREIAERCQFSLGELAYRFPRFAVPPGQTQASELRRLTVAGAAERYGSPLPARAKRQLEHELRIIEKLDLPGYFLIVHDIAAFAKRRGMIAQGRGSAANSAVCYALGITAVDPVGMELLFERFLSEERGEWPDIDLDLPSGQKREQVIQYVFDRYGERGAAMTANVITYRARSALREVGKVLELSESLVERVSKLFVTVDDREDTREVQHALAQGGIDASDPEVTRLLALAAQLRGLPRHLGQHSGGVVIADGALDEVVPIEPASMAGRRVIQWDKEDCADLGIIKIDLLGLGMLNALEESLPLIRSFEGVEVDLAKLPPDDPTTYAMLQRADTAGVFQIESRAQMAVLPRMKPQRFYDLVVQVAIIRPGPIQGKMVNPYLNRRAGREPVRYAHPSLEPILERTLGVPLFQEQLLRIAMTAAGFSGGEAEELRRAMGFRRSNDKMQRLERRLRAGMCARGIAPPAQEEILRGITSFALYGFPESHAASFALIAYASAYLKAHHPAAFLAGLLNAAPLGFYSQATLIKDFQRHGVEVLPIDVSRSCWKTTLETLETPMQSGTSKTALSVRLGLHMVRGFRSETGLALEADRKQSGAFQDLSDLAKRIPMHARELEALAELGALASIDAKAAKRRAALWQVAALEKASDSLFRGVGPAPDPVDAQATPGSLFEEFSPFEETLADYRASGVTIGPHILAHLRPQLARCGIVPANQLKRLAHGTLVHTAGHIIVRQRPQTAKGFCFLTLEDETGTMNAVLTPQTFKHFRALLQTTPLLELQGRIQNVDNVVHVYVLEASPLDLNDLPLPPSHDYR